jgi:uncharacterized membrane protein
MASGQLTPRIIATSLLRDKVVRYSVGLFVFTLFFAVGTIGTTEKTVYHFHTLLTGLLGLLCMADFLYLIDYAARLLRPVSIAGRVGKMGLAVIESVYPGSTKGLKPASNRKMGIPTRTISHEGVKCPNRPASSGFDSEPVRHPPGASKTGFRPGAGPAEPHGRGILQAG